MEVGDEMRRIIVTFLFLSVFIGHSFAFKDENLNSITIEEWHAEDDAGKYHFCNSLNYEFYINKIFSQELIVGIDDNSKGSFDQLGEACFKVLSNFNQQDKVAVSLKDSAKNFIYKIYKHTGAIEAESIVLNTNVVNKMTIEKWSLLNNDDQEKSCTILNKSLYKGNVFNAEFIREIKQRPETTFHMMTKICVDGLKNYEKAILPVKKTDLIKDYLFSVYKASGVTKSTYLWDD